MIDLRALLESGELQRIARECRGQTEFADRLGMTAVAYRSKVKRLRHKGVDFPTYEQLLGHETSHGHESQAGGDFADEEPTSPGMTPPLPPLTPGFHIKRKSTLVDGATGATKQQWIIEEQSAKQRMEALLAALPSIVEPLAGFADPVDAPSYCDDDLLAVYTLGDPHLGSHVWGEETGADDYDLKIGERELVRALQHLVSVAPPAKQAIVLSLGDFYHFDNPQQTTTKGTRQDGDTRWAKVFKTGIRAARSCTDLALAKHEHVTDIFVPGNHDMQSSTAMAVAVEQFYDREKRVTVDTSPNPFRKVRFGDVLIMICHGDEAKAERLWGVMASDYARDWGESLFRYILTGHLHHRVVQEFPGCEVERFPTLAARDRWHHGAGYRAQQTMSVDTYHRTQGRVNRSIVGVREVRAMLNRDA